MWRSGSFSRLSPVQPSGQGLWLYLLTCPESCSIPGAIVAGRAQLAEALHWPVENFNSCWLEIAGEGMALADWGARLVWLPRGPYENPPLNPNIVKSWAAVYRTLPDCKLKVRIYSDLRDFTKDFGKGFAEAFTEAFGKAFTKDLPKERVKGGVPKGVGSREEGVGNKERDRAREEPELPPGDDPEGRDQPPTPAPKRFTPPSLDQVTALVKERGYTFDPQGFINHYEANGWMVGKNRMKDWRAACAEWQRHELERRTPAGPAPPAKPTRLCQACHEPISKADALVSERFCHKCRGAGGEARAV
jgi:hypothetical protein